MVRIRFPPAESRANSDTDAAREVDRGQSARTSPRSPRRRARVTPATASATWKRDGATCRRLCYVSVIALALRSAGPPRASA